MAPTRRDILAASAGWVAVTLNVVPGLGAGYLYQRSWKAYWITSGLATTWFVLGGVLGQAAEAAEEIQNQLIGLGSLLSRREQQLKPGLQRRNLVNRIETG